jgi:hypothetical protein
LLWFQKSERTDMKRLLIVVVGDAADVAQFIYVIGVGVAP